MTQHKGLLITREFDAPRELVWKAFTEPERLAQWWGPKGFHWVGCTLDLRPGGVFHYGMRPPVGDAVMWGKWLYSEITPPSRLVFANSFADVDGNTVRAPFSETFPIQNENILTLDELDGKTILTMRSYPLNATEAEVATYEAMHASMQEGFAGTLDQLAEYLARA
jgi:uncharacterized protein YndB with AHSA1/START domain